MKQILLIHGWDYRDYNKISKRNIWDKRKNFVKALNRIFEVHILDLPGFGKCEEPECDSWTLNDYADYIKKYIKENNLKLDYILGYSFGGAVATRYKANYKAKEKLILIAPALIRNSKSKKFIHTPKILKPIRDIIRNMYLIHIAKNNETIYGTKFLRKTYQNIVREDLTGEIKNMNPDEFIIIYGDKDKMVNPVEFRNRMDKLRKQHIFLIEDASHEVGETNTEEVINIIKKQLLKK